MQKRIMVFFDIAVLAGFGAYMTMTLWQLPEDLRSKLFAASVGVLARLTGMSG